MGDSRQMQVEISLMRSLQVRHNILITHRKHDFYVLKLHCKQLIPLSAQFLTYGSNCRIGHREFPDKYSTFEHFKIFRTKIERQNCSIGQIAG